MATLQRVHRALSVAHNRPTAPGDTPAANIGDPRHEGLKPAGQIVYEIKNLAALDNITWHDLACCPPTLRHIPTHWTFSFAEARHVITKGICATANIADETERMSTRERLWKLYFMSDAILFHKPPRMRGGRRGQGNASLNALFTERLRGFWSGDWVPLWTEVEATVSDTLGKRPAQSRSEESLGKRMVSEIETMLQHNAVSRALGRVSRPVRFARGDAVPDWLRGLYPMPSVQPQPQRQAPRPSAELIDELVEHIETELRSLPPMAGAGANGSYFEHLMLHHKIADGAHALARALSQ